MTTSTTLPITACPEWCNRRHSVDLPARTDISHRTEPLTIWCDLDGNEQTQLQVRQSLALPGDDPDAWPAAVEVTIGTEARLFEPAAARQLAQSLLAMADVAERTEAGTLLDETIGDLKRWLSSVGRPERRA